MIFLKTKGGKMEKITMDIRIENARNDIAEKIIETIETHLAVETRNYFDHLGDPTCSTYYNFNKGILHLTEQRKTFYKHTTLHITLDDDINNKNDIIDISEIIHRIISQKD